MSRFKASQALVSKNVLLDGRLALFHRRERWLAIADLHFGYELSQRAAGNLFPLWGMQSIEQRLQELLRDYKPLHLILLGDLVHDCAAAAALPILLRKLQQLSTVIVILGNHDRTLTNEIDFVPSWQSNGFCFHHGHCAMDEGAGIQIIGHHHPAGTVRDGAGLRLRLPAFVQQGDCWIMPAFSPWAAGSNWPESDSAEMWLCSPTRILRMNQTSQAASAEGSAAEK